jgi:hypothetical protein
MVEAINYHTGVEHAGPRQSPGRVWMSGDGVAMR